MDSFDCDSKHCLFQPLYFPAQASLVALSLYTCRKISVNDMKEFRFIYELKRSETSFPEERQSILNVLLRDAYH